MYATAAGQLARANTQQLLQAQPRYDADAPRHGAVAVDYDAIVSNTDDTDDEGDNDDADDEEAVQPFMRGFRMAAASAAAAAAAEDGEEATAAAAAPQQRKPARHSSKQQQLGTFREYDRQAQQMAEELRLLAGVVNAPLTVPSNAALAASRQQEAAAAAVASDFDRQA
jgi:hypothetical protein